MSAERKKLSSINGSVQCRAVGTGEHEVALVPARADEPYRKRKKPPCGVGIAVGAMCPIAPNALWALDFQFDVTVDGRTLKLLNVVDEFTRECSAIVVDRSIDADRVVAALDAIAVVRGYPAFARFDNGPEFVAQAVADWCRSNGVGSIFIDPGSPWQNA